MLSSPSMRQIISNNLSLLMSSHEEFVDIDEKRNTTSWHRGRVSQTQSFEGSTAAKAPGSFPANLQQETLGHGEKQNHGHHGACIHDQCPGNLSHLQQQQLASQSAHLQRPRPSFQVQQEAAILQQKTLQQQITSKGPEQEGKRSPADPPLVRFKSSRKKMVLLPADYEPSNYSVICVGGGFCLVSSVIVFQCHFLNFFSPFLLFALLF